MKHPKKKRNLNVKLMTLLTLGLRKRGKICKKGQKQKKLFSHTFGEKTKCMALIFIKPSTKIVKFMAHWSDVQTLGWSQYYHIGKYIKV